MGQDRDTNHLKASRSFCAFALPSFGFSTATAVFGTPDGQFFPPWAWDGPPNLNDPKICLVLPQPLDHLGRMSGSVGVQVDPRLFKEVHSTKHGLVRIYKVLNVSLESKEWVAGRACAGSQPTRMVGESFDAC